MMGQMTSERKFKSKKVLITGGAGFIGSSLAEALVTLGADVTVVDALLPLYGGNLFNLEPVKDKITFIQGDIRDRESMLKLVKDQNYIFDLAAQVSYLDSKDIPFVDLDINCRGHLNVLEAVRQINPKARVLFASSRLVYGKILTVPVTEDHPTNPLSIYGIHKLTAEKYYRYYHDTFGLDTLIVRIPNPYGPRQQMKHNKYSIMGWFLRQAMEGKTITIFGDGEQERDYLYIDDIVDAFLALAVKGQAGEVYNLGTRERVTFVRMVDEILAVAGTGRKNHIPWPANYEKNETGDYVADTGKIEAVTGWEAKIGLHEGIGKMVDYYRRYQSHYWLPSGDFSLPSIAREYIKQRFPRASQAEHDKYVKDWVSKVEKSNGVADDFAKRTGTNLIGQRILEAGCGNGGMAVAFAQAGAKMVGVEIEPELVEIARAQAFTNGVEAKFEYYDGEHLPFDDGSFDATLSVSVLEHVTDPVNYLTELLRVVKSGGYLYLAFPNRLWPQETHTRLFFVSWLPLSWIDRMVQWFGRNPLADNNLHFYTYWSLKRMLKQIKIADRRWEIVAEEGVSHNLLKNIVKKILGWFGLSYKTFLPHVSVILKKSVSL